MKNSEQQPSKNLKQENEIIEKQRKREEKYL